jgi:hypothetical protein
MAQQTIPTEMSMRKYLFLLNILTSAFLLFQIQPILAKGILPTFGGGASVWTTSMLFFQALLFLGYFHAYCLSLLRSVKLQLIIQLTLLLISAGIVSNLLQQVAIEDISSAPEMSILSILFIQIGLPFYLLSSTGVLLQHWYTQYTVKKSSAYPYYAWSNLGSLAALLTYPFLLETYLGLANQKLLWLILYSFFLLINAALIVSIYRDKSILRISKVRLSINKSKRSHLFLWISLPAAGVMVLLSTTHLLTLNITPMPFLWVLPLSLYLVSYILSFSKYNLYSRSYWLPMFLFCIFAALLMFFLGSQFNSLSQILMYSLILFVTCMVCHGELRQHTPGAENLTLFYLCLAAGGFLGGMLVTLIAPIVFIKLTEYPITMLLIYLLVGISYFVSRSITNLPKSKFFTAWSMGLVGLVVSFLVLDKAYTRFDIISARNFYGYLTVKDVHIGQQISRRLVDGTTVHGSQNLTKAREPIKGYFGSNTGISIAIKYVQRQSIMKMAVIGLGAGVLADYGRNADQIDFYEINPNVNRFANTYFDYLPNSVAKTDVILGDGRLSLESELRQLGSKQLDLLVIDAFSSDAIPTHLITLEAFHLYWQHLRENGLLVMHITNNHIDLKPVISALADDLNKHVQIFKSYSNDLGNYASEWLVISDNLEFINLTESKRNSTKLVIAEGDKILWTDDFNNLLSVIKI